MQIKLTFGAAMLAAIVVITGSMAASASAETTTLCDTHEEPCQPGNQLKSLHMVNTPGTIGELLAVGGIELTALCLNVLAQAEVLGPGSAPNELSQSIHTTELNFTNCGTNALHNNCTVNTAIKLPLFELSKTALNLGTLEATSGEALVRCVIGGIIVIDCTYNAKGLTAQFEGALHKGSETGHGMVSLNKVALPLASGGGFCPEKSFIHGLLEPLEHAYVTDAAPPQTTLCDTHEEPCQPGNQLKSLHMVNTPGTIGELLAVGGIELTALCLNVLAQAEVLGPGSAPNELSQSIHTTELNFTNCGTNALHNNCTVNTAIKLPLFELSKTALNLGTLEATSGEALVRCVIGGIIVIDCTYNAKGLTAQFEGALHKGSETGHGMVSLNKVALPLASGGALCPEKSFIHGLLEPLEHAYVTS